jgi:hypothetical protein
VTSCWEAAREKITVTICYFLFQACPSLYFPENQYFMVAESVEA